MAPKLFEVNASQKDFAEDALKALVIVATGYVLNQWQDGMGTTQSVLMSVLLGLFAHYFIVDPHVVRFVVKQGQEGYYTASRRFA